MMFSFWPWKSDDSSPASFEKALSTLSEKISKTSNKLDSLRQRSRRVTGLWTLYSLFLYLLYSVILVTVVGWRNWAVAEYVAVLGGPFVFYFVRLGVSSYYRYRTSNVQGHLEDLQNQRDTTIKKLKAATKYDTTQELLKKYGGSPTPKPKVSGDSSQKSRLKQSGDPTSAQGRRTSFVPPPTANIPRNNEQSPSQGRPQHPNSPQESSPTPPLGRPSTWQQDSPSPGGSAEFAPNAFPSAPQYAAQGEGPRWYDRFMDLLMGEDETLPGKRLALICQKCRLVNGQAPPGTQRLEDVGKWRCAACGTMNGKENEVKKIVASIQNQKAIDRDQSEPTERDSSPNGTMPEEDSDETQYSSQGEKQDSEPVEVPRKTEEPSTTERRSTRAKKSRKEEH